MVEVRVADAVSGGCVRRAFVLGLVGSEVEDRRSKVGGRTLEVERQSPWEGMPFQPALEKAAERKPKGNPGGAEREPKGAKREPKGARGEPKGAQMEPKGSQREAKEGQKASQK